MKINKSTLKKLIKEEIEEIKLIGKVKVEEKKLKNI